jgi:prevent-host-death family protein
MQTVNVTELQTNLIAWLERVRAGEEVLVSDLNRPIARLLPVEIGDGIEAEELEMAAAGLVRLPT